MLFLALVPSKRVFVFSIKWSLEDIQQFTGLGLDAQAVVYIYEKTICEVHHNQIVFS